MKLSAITFTGLLLLLAQNSQAEYFCIADQGKPSHCAKGDIILIRPTLVPRVCDFDAQILRMPKTDKTAEYLCRYTGVILDIKELQSRRQAANPPPALMPPPSRKKNTMFDGMPFFK